MYFGGLPRPLPLTLGNWEYSNPIDGSYIIPNIKYTGTSAMFDIKPSKSSNGFAHNSVPAQQVALIEDILLAAKETRTSRTFPFEVNLRVTYQDFDANVKEDYSSGTGTASGCPVQGVSFLIDGTVYQDDSQEPVVTDSLGYATVFLPRGGRYVCPSVERS